MVAAKEILAAGLVVPVLHGDAVIDADQGSSIVSGNLILETLCNDMAPAFWGASASASARQKNRRTRSSYGPGFSWGNGISRWASTLDTAGATVCRNLDLGSKTLLYQHQKKKTQTAARARAMQVFEQPVSQTVANRQ
jgi:hypothetical protein